MNIRLPEDMEKLEEKVRDIVINRPHEIEISSDYNRSYQYVKVGRTRVEFEDNLNPKIVAIYKKYSILEELSIKTSTLLKQFYRQRYRMAAFATIATGLLYFVIDGWKPLVEQSIRCKTGYNTKYIGNGKFLLTGSRKKLNGSKEDVKIVADIWGNATVDREGTDGTRSTSSASYDGGHITYKTSDHIATGEQKSEEIKWDKPEGTAKNIGSGVIDRESNTIEDKKAEKK